MRVITLDRVKELLGIDETTYDADLQIALPIIDAAVKQITGNQYNHHVYGSTENGSDSVSLIMDIESVQVGQLISGDGIPADTYVEEIIYDDGILTVTMSEDATASGDLIDMWLGIPISYQPVIAKAVWWQKDQFSTTITDDAWSSKSMGPVSVTKAGGSEKLDGKTGMPLWFVRAFPRYHGGH